MAILDDLYDGKLKPSQLCFKKDSEYDEKMNEFFQKLDELKQDLDEKEKKLLDEIVGKQSELSSLSQKASFSKGVRIGALLIWEILHPEESDFI